ncbi:MAG: septal ring lytic transglycosylase RlpA family protein [Treponema sp.]|jgi:rare lipoprotein A (peptidoglycan hydrolase)|nr:septal ring lytic transglycosylase RlpA family protein [Treponema sp.]
MKKAIVFAAFLGFFMVIPAFAQDSDAQSSELYMAEGMASWYGSGSGLFASHANLPFGMEIRITNLENGKQVNVKVGGRIPLGDRILDISPEAANILEINTNTEDLTPVRIEEVAVEVVRKIPRTIRMRNFYQRGRATVAVGMDLTAGHPSLSVGRQIKITNQANNRSVVATVKNRVRASQLRVIEVSRAVAQALGGGRSVSYLDVTVESVDK